MTGDYSEGLAKENIELLSGLNIICFSHLRWDFIVQRPQHIMSRLAKFSNIIFWEEPVIGVVTGPQLNVSPRERGIVVITPHLPIIISEEDRQGSLKNLIERFIGGLSGPIARWYYTPMMLDFSRGIDAVFTVYDCMDELSNFRFAAPELEAREAELFEVADVVFTGGYSLYEAKKSSHSNIYPIPSSVDRQHFASSRDVVVEPSDQAGIPRPRLGFFGVVDERMDIDLLKAIAEERPDWAIVVVGPIVKIDPAQLPACANIHYLGIKTYSELPRYAAGWDVAVMPFILNESTRYISPTKTPEYLAAGLPVVSTAIVDVQRHYELLEAVRIAHDTDGFIAACDGALKMREGGRSWRDEADAAIAEMSWDNVVSCMLAQIRPQLQSRANATFVKRPNYDVLVVGAGFAGAVMAERLAAGSGKRVLVIDRRAHIAGNAYDHVDDAGILVHRYGPHIFHTNSDEVFKYLSRFTDWRPYEHRVLAEVDGKRVPMPINRTTLNELFGLSLNSDDAVATFLQARAEPIRTIRTSADVVISKIGQELYEKFFRGYTRKQWGLDPSELDKSVTSRVPTRTSDEDRYFIDSYQAMPAAGYTVMFERMLDHPNIDLELGVEFADVKGRISFDKLIFTGPVDEYFDYRYGKLPYRSLRFDHQSLETECFQSVAVVNYPDEHIPYTRITEYKWLTGQVSTKTSISYEYPCAEGEPYYPIPTQQNYELYDKYRTLSLESGVEFVGRLATYRYYNMDQVVGQALSAYRKMAKFQKPLSSAPRRNKGALADAAE